MKYLFFDTAVNGYYTLLALQKEAANGLPLISKEENISDDVAPFIFEISDERLKQFLSTEYISFKEILFIESGETITSVRDYFSLFVLQPIDGKTFYFRFWAANVFVKYIKTCDVNQLSDFFKMVNSFTCDDKGEMVQFSFKGNKLITETITSDFILPGQNEILPDDAKASVQNNGEKQKRKEPRKFF